MIKDLQDLIATQLFVQRGQRRTELASQYPDVEATTDGVEVEAVPGIVLPTLETEGFHQVSGTTPNLLRQYYLGRLDSNTNEVLYLSVTWQDDDYATSFNPYTDIEAFTLPTADPKYIIEPNS